MPSYRQSLFFYIKWTEPPYFAYYRITIFTWRPIEETKLLIELEKYVEEEYTEKGDFSYEEEEVLPGEAKGLGYYWAVVHREERGFAPKELDRFFWPYYEKTGVRLGPSYFMALLSRYKQVVRLWERIGATIIEFWEWLAY